MKQYALLFCMLIKLSRFKLLNFKKMIVNSFIHNRIIINYMMYAFKELKDEVENFSRKLTLCESTKWNIWN